MQATEKAPSSAKSETDSSAGTSGLRPGGRTAGSAGSGFRRAGLVVVILASLVAFLSSVNAHYRIEEWLFWRYATYVLVTVAWAVCCMSAGYRVIASLLGVRVALREQLVLAFPSGLIVFQLGVFLLGLVGALNAVSFVLLPLALLSIGAPVFFPKARSFMRHVRPRWKRRGGVAPWVVALWSLGVLAVALLYFQILSPDTLGFDARWYHFAAGEHYAAAHRIGRSPEGWFVAAYPQLATYLFTWAFLVPGQSFDKVELARHLELAAFIGMLTTIPVAVRKLVPRAPSWPSWVSYFLFPEIFLYDSNLNGGADHVAAVFALPLGLTLLRAWPVLDVRACAAFALMSCGVILTKYSAYPLLAAPFIALTLRALWLLIRSRSIRDVRRSLEGPFAAVGCALVITASLWLKNWIWYGDPFYPILRDYFSDHPFVPEANYTWKRFMGLMAPAPPGWDGVQEALRATAMFPFEVHDWPMFHRDVPVFGVLFTFTFLCLPFVRARARLWFVYVASFLAVFLWYFPCHYERYLRTTVPWMVAATGATMVLVWRAGVLPRVVGGTLVFLQAVWGGDVYFFPTHNVAGDSSVRVVSKLISSGFMRTKNRLSVNEPYWGVARALPPNSRVLLHELPLHLGIEAPSVSDLWQGRIAYGRLLSPSAIHREFRELGVTHLLWNPDRAEQYDSLAGDIAFYAFAKRYGQMPRTFGPIRLARMASSMPDAPFDDRVAYFGCDGRIARGLYRLGDLHVLPGFGHFPAPMGPLPPGSEDTTDAPIAVFEPSCGSTVNDNVVKAYEFLFHRPPLDVFVRRTP